VGGWGKSGGMQAQPHPGRQDASLTRRTARCYPPSTYCLLHSILLLLFFTFGILASKRLGRDRSKSKSRTRSKTRSKFKSRSLLDQRQQRPIFAHFVIPLAGLLSAFTARLYDMGETSTSQAPEVDERAPLLGASENERNTEPQAPVKRAGKWAVRNAVIIFMSLLVLAVIIVLCIFFASKSHSSVLYHKAPINQGCLAEQSLTRS
jgi:ABC-type Fe3+ transport system permease subunit